MTYELMQYADMGGLDVLIGYSSEIDVHFNRQ